MRREDTFGDVFSTTGVAARRQTAQEVIAASYGTLGALTPMRAGAASLPDRVSVKIIRMPMHSLPYNEGPQPKYPTSTGFIPRSTYVILHAALVDLGSVKGAVVYDRYVEYLDGKLVRTYDIASRAAVDSVLQRTGMPPLSTPVAQPLPTRTAALTFR